MRKSGTGLLADGAIIAAGALVALVLLYSLWSFSPALPNISASPPDPPDPTFYDEPGFSPTGPVKNWDERRRRWLQLHPNLAAGSADRILMVTGSQPGPCKGPAGDHLLLLLFKNKVDYCRRHGYDIFYNTALLDPKMHTFWAKYPVLRATMLAHPETEWVWWVDSDAAITDMGFRLPQARYRAHNLVVHGWPALARTSWLGVNAGVFLIRNCQWSLDLIERWASMGPASPDYDAWGPLQRAAFPDKLFPESDDQSGLLYLMRNEPAWRAKIYIENEYYFQGYWAEIVNRLENITMKYSELENKTKELQRPHSEKMTRFYELKLEEHLKGVGYGKEGWRRPFITHFTGCQPCSGNHNRIYSSKSCLDGMEAALNFADNQVLRDFGYVRPDLLDSSRVEPVSFDHS